MIKIALSKMRLVEKPGRDFDWATFNDGFVNGETDAFGLINAIYQGRAFAPQMNGRRKVENFLCAQHAAIDLDTGDYRSSFDFLAEHPLVRQYGAILYETPSHAPENPRSRVVFLLDAPITSAEGYRLALRTLTALFDGADEACVDPARFFFGNGKLQANGRTEGIWFTEQPLFPLEELRILARQHMLAEKKKREEARRAEPTRLDRPPLVEGKPDLNRVSELLSRVDPYRLDYKTWLKVVAALRHEYGDAAFPLARDWSDRADKEPLTQKKWNSFNSSSNPATIATILYVCRMHGG